MKQFDEDVIKVVADLLKIQPAKIQKPSRFVQDLGVDSIVAAEILSTLEEKYNIEIPEEKMKELFTVQDLISYVHSLLPEDDY